jgi:branched-chain amino acid transport system permease protein
MRESIKVTIAVGMYFSGLSNQFLVISFVNGMQSAALFVLLALGLSLIFGIMGVVNFAHGALFMTGAYSTWYIANPAGLGQPYLVGVIGGVIVTGFIGFLIEVGALRRLYDKNLLLQVLFTFGVALVLQGTVEYIFGSSAKTLATPEWGRGTTSLFGYTYSTFRLLIIIATILLVIGIYVFLRRTNVGLIIRAGTRDAEMVRALGIDIQRVFTLVFVIGSALAGLAGALAIPIRSMGPGVGNDIIIDTFVVVVVGGLGSLIGMVLSGIAIAEISTFSTFIPVLERFSATAIFVFMAIVLLIRPRGLLGEEGFHEN